MGWSLQKLGVGSGDRTEWCVYVGGSPWRELPKQTMRYLRGQERAEKYAHEVLARYPAVLWLAMGRGAANVEVRYYRDIEGSVKLVDPKATDESSRWVGALFADESHEPSGFVILANRATAIARVTDALNSGSGFKRAWVMSPGGAGLGWISGAFADEFTRADDGAVTRKDVLEERRLDRIKTLQKELSDLAIPATGPPVGSGQEIDTL